MRYRIFCSLFLGLAVAALAFSSCATESESAKEGSSTQEAPADGQAADTPSEDPSGPEEPAEEPSGPEEPAEEPSGPEEPAEEPSGPEKPAEEPSGPEEPAEEPSGPEEPAEEPSGPEEPAEEPSGPEKPAEEPSGPEEPAAGAATAEAFDQAFSAQYPDIARIYRTTLHHTGEGMRSWYDAKDGFSSISGVPYDELGCKSCHATSCAKCHASSGEGGFVFDADKAPKRETCLACHVRAGAALRLDEKAGTQGVHTQCGLACTQCHRIHPDKEQNFRSMRQPGATEADCQACHKEGGDAPAPDEGVKGHKRHLRNLHCNACHVSNTITCYNCHFDEFLRTRTKKGNFLAPVKANVFLLNYQGKVTSGNIQTLVSKGKTFVAYAPYFTHSIRAKGRSCEECHATEAAQILKKGETLPVMTYENGEVKMRPGIIPVVPDQLRFLFFDKKDGAWTLLETDEKPAVQFVGFGEPLTEIQIRKLAMRFR